MTQIPLFEITEEAREKSRSVAATPEAMKKVFVCSPFRGDVEANMKLARRLCHMAVTVGVAPFAPHIFYTQFLDDSIPDQRNLGILCGEEWLLKCDELWAFVPPGSEPSAGMRYEIDLANRANIPVRINPDCWKILIP